MKVIKSWTGLTIEDKKSLFYILTAIISASYITDGIDGANEIQRVINLIALTITSLTIGCEYMRILNLNTGIKTVIYTLVAASISCYYTHNLMLPGSDFFFTASILAAILPIIGLLIGKRHTLILGVILLLFWFSALFFADAYQFTRNFGSLTILMTSYTIGNYYLILLIDRGIASNQYFHQEGEKNKKHTQFLSSLAMKLTSLPMDADISPIMIEQVKEYATPEFALFSIYNSTSKRLEVKHASFELDDIQAIQLQAEQILMGTQYELTNAQIELMTQQKVHLKNSVCDTILQVVPNNFCTSIKRVTNIETYMIVIHHELSQLYGATLMGFKKDAELPSIASMQAYSFITSVTLKKQLTQSALEKSEAQLRQMTDQISDVVFVMDLDFNVSYISPSIERLTGDNSLIHQSKTMVDKYTAESLIIIKNTIEDELGKELEGNTDLTRSRMVDLDMYDKNGKVINVSTHATFIRNKKGQPIGIQGIIRNITQRKKIELKLQKSQSELKRLVADKNRFLKIISHDLRAPFQTLSGYTEVMMANVGESTKEEITHGLEVIHHTSQSAYDMLTDLLLWSTAESKGLKLELQQVNTQSLCNDIIRDMSFSAHRKGIRFTNNIPPRCNVMADPNILKTVIRNLLSNALKYSHPESEIEIFSEERKFSSVVGVRDQGVGMSAEQLQRLWRKGENQNFSTPGTTNQKGTGTGLLLCKELIDRHGGQIWAESEEGKGSVFLFELKKITMSTMN